MALIDKASLLMVPSTYEAGKLYNVLPSGNRAPDSTDQNSGYDQTRADFDFDRGSNAAATRIGSDGLLKKYRENELLQSNQFDTTWNSQGVLTSGQADKDGGTSAWSFTSASGTSGLYQNITTGGVQTFSAYVKKNATHGLRIYMFGGLNAATYFNLNTGSVVSSLGGTLNASIEAYNSEWWRISVTCNTTLSQIYFYCTNNNQTQVVGTITIQNAQLESGLVSTDYLDSTSVTGKAGVLVDLPRINYDANGENGSLLLEPSRQNLATYSELFGSSYYLNAADVDVTYTPNYGTSPEGVKNSTRVQFANDTAFSYRAVSLSADNTASLYVKGTSGEKIRFGFGTSVAGGGVIHTFDGTWQRVVHTASSGTQLYLSSYTNDNQALDFEIYGLQHEAGSYASSYIPTMGTTETRAADFMSSTNNLLAGADDMAWFVDYTLEKESTSSFRNQFGYRDNADANFYMVQFPNSNTHEFRYRGVGGVNVDMTPSIDESTYGLHRKIVYLKRGTTLKVFCNGSQISTTTNAGATTFSTTNENFEVGSNYPPEMNIKEFVVFNGTISDAEAITLTTL